MLARVFALLAISLTQGLAAQVQAPWIAWKHAKIQGNVTFSADAIRAGVCWSPPAVVALRDGDLAAAREVIARCVTEGYRNSGFHDVKVGVTSSDAHFVVEIAEGDRLRCGAIVVTGNRRVATADLQTDLMTKAGSAQGRAFTAGHEDALLPADFAGHWLPTNFARSGAASAEVAAAAVRSAYAELGYAKTRVEVSFQRNGDRLDLHVEVADEGEQIRVASLVIIGERTADLPAVMQRLDFQPNCLFTNSFCNNLERQLLRTGRYATVKCDAPPPNQPLLDPLVVRVRRVGYAPSDDAATQRDMGQLLAAFDQLAGHFQAGRGIQGGFDIGTGSALLGAWIGPGAVSLILDQGAMRFTVAALRGPSGSFASFACDLTSDGLLLVHGDRWAAVRCDGLLDFSLTIRSQPSPHTGFASQEFRWGFNLSRGGAPPPLVHFHPTTAAYLLRGESTRCRRDGELLMLHIGDTDLRIAADGTFTPRAVSEGTTTPDPSTTPVRIALLDEPQQVDLAALRAKLPAEKQVPLLGLLWPFATAGAIEWLAAHDIDLGEALPLLRSAAWLALPTTVEALVDGGADYFRATVSKQDTVTSEVAAVIGLAATRIGAFWPGDGWPAVMLNVGPHMLGAEGGLERGAKHLYELRQDPRLGPLALGAIGGTLHLLGFEQPAGVVLEEALARCTFDAAFADLDSMTPPDGFVGQALRAVGQHWRADPATAALCAVPDGQAADLAACRRGLQVLWDAGLGACLRRALGEGR